VIEDVAPSLITKVKAFHSPSVKGIVCGCQNGELIFFVFNDQMRLFQMARVWNCKELMGTKILSLAIFDKIEKDKEDEIYLCISSNHKSIVYLDIVKSFFSEEAQLADSDEFISYKTVANGFHQDQISKLSCSLHRPLVISCSKDDCQVRIYNYATGLCELAKVYFYKDGDRDKKALKSVAIHPSGYYLAICTERSIMMTFILHNDLFRYKTWEIKNCSEVTFSNGGHLLAACDLKNLYILNALTMELI
jgi:WD40 repeat protein